MINQNCLMARPASRVSRFLYDLGKRARSKIDNWESINQRGEEMKIGRLITSEGVEFSVESSQLRKLIEYLQRQEANEASTSELGATREETEFIDPEDYERAIQAANLVCREKALRATNQK